MKDTKYITRGRVFATAQERDAYEQTAALAEAQAQLRFIFERVLCFSAGMANHRMFYKRLDGTANTVTGPTFEACLKLALGDPR